MSPQTVGLGSSIDHERAWDLGYELLELSRSETYCDIWRIRHRSTYELFAWKQLRPECEADPHAHRALENEAAVGQLVHSPLLLKLVAVHLNERPSYVIWEWFEARSLDQLLREYVRLPISSALWIARQCAAGLDALLQAGLIHGDLQSANILIDPQTGLIKLTELGSCRRAPHAVGFEADRPRSQSGPLADYDSVVSATHLRGATRDLYSLGTILYRALAGRMPFAADTPAEMVRGRRVNVPEELLKARPEVSSALADVVGDLLSPQPGRQIQHPSELVNRLMELEVAELARLSR